MPEPTSRPNLDVTDLQTTNLEHPEVRKPHTRTLRSDIVFTFALAIRLATPSPLREGLALLSTRPPFPPAPAPAAGLRLQLRHLSPPLRQRLGQPALQNHRRHRPPHLLSAGGRIRLQLGALVLCAAPPRTTEQNPAQGRRPHGPLAARPG